MALAFYFLVWWHFLVLIMLIMIISGIISFLFPRFPSAITVLLSGLLGYIYSIIVDGVGLAIYIIAICMVFSLIPVLMAKYAYFLKRKAKQMEEKYENRMEKFKKS